MALNRREVKKQNNASFFSGLLSALKDWKELFLIVTFIFAAGAAASVFLSNVVVNEDIAALEGQLQRRMNDLDDKIRETNLLIVKQIDEKQDQLQSLIDAQASILQCEIAVRDTRNFNYSIYSERNRESTILKMEIDKGFSEDQLLADKVSRLSQVERERDSAWRAFEQARTSIDQRACFPRGMK